MMKNNIKAFCVFLTMSVVGIMGVNAQDDADSIRSIPNNNDSLVNVAFGKTARRDLLGAISSVNVSEVLTKSYGTYSLDNLQSFVGGYNGNIWGQGALVLVDGVPRNASDVRMVEIASVSVLKGANAVALYGSTASKGVVLITTKRGVAKPLSIDVRVNTGLNTPKRYPDYLNAAEYMTLYNEASRNDGIAERYSQEEIYNTSTGKNPYRYPDLNFFSADYLKKAYSKSDLTTEISGGNENARYYSNIGFSYNNSLMNLGESRKNNDVVLNIRTNVDMNLTKWLKASTDAVANVSNSFYRRGDFWGASASVRPNLFSPYVPISMLDTTNSNIRSYLENSNNIIDGKYLLGGISTNQTNELSQMLASGYIKNKNRTFMFNVGAEADLNSILKGLSFNAKYSMDYTSRYTEGYTVGYATYEPAWMSIDGGDDLITNLVKYGNDASSTNEFIGTTLYYQITSAATQFNYKRTFDNKHNVTASLLGWGYISQFSSDPDTNGGGGDYHPKRNTNLGFQAGYNFLHRYYFDFTGNMVHSAKLPENNRNAFSPTLTVGWRMSDEAFFKNNLSFVDDLKINASYASLKQDIDITGTRQNGDPTDYYLYQGYYGNTGALGGWYQWRDGVAGGWTTLSGQGANPNLTFIERKEFRIGLDGSLFRRLVTFDVNYFTQKTNGLLTRGGSTIYPSYFTGSGSFLPFLNYNNDKRTGVDFSVNFNSKVGELYYSFGVNGMYYNSEAARRDEVYLDDYQNRAGKPLDAYWGLLAEGIFMDQADIDNHARQTFSAYGPGDIKYKDVNSDGIIDSRDEVDLGKNGWAVSPFTYGLNFTLKYKRITLFALGSGQNGSIGFKNNNYFWVNGTRKYSDVVLDRTTIQKNVAGEWEVAQLGSYPRLTTTGNTNNYRNSTFWMYKNDRFNLSRVQLTYDFNDAVFKKSFVHALSIYVNGDNLLVLSKERKMMETNYGSAPQYRFYNIGLKATF